MPLNKQKGKMYNFVTHTWNPIKGKCEHDCQYCYMKRWPQKEIRLDEQCYTDDLGHGNTIFVGSSTDMFAENIPGEWITQVLNYCKKFEDNTYLFQTKNPLRFHTFYPLKKIIYATTIETNIQFLIDKYSKAPSISKRVYAIQELNFRKMLTIEPIMQFNLAAMVEIVKKIKPYQVNIGADSGGHGLPEPSKKQIGNLIHALDNFTEVHIKSTLHRLLK